MREAMIDSNSQNEFLEYPPIDVGMFYLFRSEIRYDKLLCLDGTIYTSGSNKEWVELFESYDEAKKYGEKQVEDDPEVVVTIQNSEREPVLIIKNEARYAEIRENEFGIGKKKWWKFWKD